MQKILLVAAMFLVTFSTSCRKWITPLHGNTQPNDSTQPTPPESPGDTVNYGAVKPFSEELQVAALSPGRQYIAATVADGRIFFAGGFSDTYSDQVDIYDLTTGVITQAHLSQPRAFTAAAALGDWVLFAGGSFFLPGSQTLLFSSRVDIYNIKTNQWTIAELPRKASSLRAATAGNKIFFGGGEYWDSSNNDVYVFDTNTQEWTTIHISAGRGELAMGSLGGKVFFAGGTPTMGDLSRWSPLVDIYDVASDTWSTAKLSKGQSRLTCVTLNNSIYFIGGDRMEIYNIDNNTWSVKMLSESKVWVPAGVSNGKLVLLGGMKQWFIHSTTIEIYDPTTETFEYSTMNSDLMFEGIVSYNNSIYTGGGSIEGGDRLVQGVYQLNF